MEMTKETWMKDLSREGAHQLAENVRMGIRKSAIDKLVAAAGVADADLFSLWLLKESQGKGHLIDLGDKFVPVGDIMEAREKVQLTDIEKREIDIVRKAVFGF